jgi:hypothetical protein
MSLRRGLILPSPLQPRKFSIAAKYSSIRMPPRRSTQQLLPSEPPSPVFSSAPTSETPSPPDPPSLLPAFSSATRPSYTIRLPRNPQHEPWTPEVEQLLTLVVQDRRALCGESLKQQDWEWVAAEMERRVRTRRTGGRRDLGSCGGGRRRRPSLPAFVLVARSMVNSSGGAGAGQATDQLCVLVDLLFPRAGRAKKRPVDSAFMYGEGSPLGPKRGRLQLACPSPGTPTPDERLPTGTILEPS